MNPLTSQAPRPGAGSAAHDWHWYAPRVAIGLFVLALLGLLWVLHRQELDEKRSAVIRDILWVEQNFRFRLARDQEQLGQLGADSAGLGQGEIEVRAGYLLQNSPGLLRVHVLDEQGRLRASAPVSAEPGRPFEDPEGQGALELARSTGNPAYAPPRAAGQEHLLEVFVPYYRDGHPAGTVVGVYGLRAVLATLVPWWLAEKHLVTIRDASGAVLAAKSNVVRRRGPDARLLEERDRSQHPVQPDRDPGRAALRRNVATARA